MFVLWSDIETVQPATYFNYVMIPEKCVYLHTNSFWTHLAGRTVLIFEYICNWQTTRCDALLNSTVVARTLLSETLSWYYAMEISILSRHIPCLLMTWRRRQTWHLRWYLMTWRRRQTWHLRWYLMTWRRRQTWHLRWYLMTWRRRQTWHLWWYLTTWRRRQTWHLRWYIMTWRRRQTWHLRWYLKANMASAMVSNDLATQANMASAMVSNDLATQANMAPAMVSNDLATQANMASAMVSNDLATQAHMASAMVSNDLATQGNMASAMVLTLVSRWIAELGYYEISSPGHECDVTLPLMCLKSPADQLFVQYIFRLTKKKQQTPHYRTFPPVNRGFRHKNVSMSWRHYILAMSQTWYLQRSENRTLMDALLVTS